MLHLADLLVDEIEEAVDIDVTFVRTESVENPAKSDVFSNTSSWAFLITPLRPLRVPLNAASFRGTIYFQPIAFCEPFFYYSVESYKPEFDRTGSCNSLGKKLVEVLDLRVVIQIGLEKSHPVRDSDPICIWIHVEY
jgi:hypothetical protein